jgi:hypothetical protein|tara:strand:+ start:346 stop:543 length:198 start_codon:yes stop_codon:yes gene_type:complete
MGKVKAWIMDLEEQFYDKVDENDLCVDSFEEFVAIAKEKIGDAMSPNDIQYVASNVWNDYWGNYI